MTDSPRYACIRAVTAALKSGNGPWGDRVYLNRGESGADYPYLMITFSGGGETNRIRSRNGDAGLVLIVRAVSDNLEQCATADQTAAALINDRGTQDVSTGYLEGGANWRILTSTREDFISYEDYVSESRAIYHEGARYRFSMEAI